MGKIKFLFVILILICPGLKPALWPLSAEEPFHADFYADSKKTFGTKLRLPVAEVRFSTRELENYNWGLSFSSKKIWSPAPVTIKGGNLSAGGMLSHLNNPSLSAGTSPFSTGILTPSVMTASLPGYSSFSKPQSVFFQLEAASPTASPAKPTSAPTKITSIINCYYIPDSPSPVFSSQISLALFQKKLRLYLSSTGGVFDYSDNANSSWFMNEIFYNKGTHLCAINQFCAEYKAAAQGPSAQSTSAQVPSFFTGLTAAVYETPFCDFPMNLRLDLKLKTNRSEIFASAFYNPKDGLITSSQKSLPSCAQFKAGFTVKRLAGRRISTPLLIKAGANALCEVNLFSSQTQSSTQGMTQGMTQSTLNAGVQFSSPLTALSFSSSYKMQDIDFSGISFQLKNIWYLKQADTGLTLNVSFSPDKSTSQNKSDCITSKYKIALSLNRSGKLNLYGNTAFSFSYKQSELSSAILSAALTSRLVFAHLTFTGKFLADIDLYLE